MPKAFKWNEPAEKDIERAILYFLNYQIGCFAFKVDTQARFDPRIGMYRSLNKLILPGTPDILCCYSINGVGVFIAFEVKALSGRQGKHQLAFQEKLQDRANGFYFIVRSVKDPEEALKKVQDQLQPRIQYVES